MKTRKIYFWLIALFVGVMSFSSCTVEVPPGYQAMKLMPEGFTGEVVGQGRYSCFARQRMVLTDSREEKKSESLSILCADDMNFSFNVDAIFKTRKFSGTEFTELMIRKGSDLESFQLQGAGKTGARLLSFDILYNTYAAHLVRSVARSIVGKLETTQIVENREKIEAEIFTELGKLLEDTPLELRQVTTSNFDYPILITNSVEEIKKLEIAIGEEKARQARLLQDYTNRLKLAQKRKARRAKEAIAEKGFIFNINVNLTDSYLDLREIEAQKKLYGVLGEANTVVIGGKSILEK
ncbi:hypothetical protein HOD29_05060 [archaeon]|jgi:hypothetical protein|nr:hypothetical protein [archaeon]